MHVRWFSIDGDEEHSTNDKRLSETFWGQNSFYMKLDLGSSAVFDIESSWKKLSPTPIHVQKEEYLLYLCLVREGIESRPSIVSWCWWRAVMNVCKQQTRVNHVTWHTAATLQAHKRDLSPTERAFQTPTKKCSWTIFVSLNAFYYSMKVEELMQQKKTWCIILIDRHVKRRVGQLFTCERRLQLRSPST